MQHARLLHQDPVAMLLCCADVEAPCMFNTLCAELGLPFDQLLKKEETGMGTKLLLQKAQFTQPIC